MTTNRGSTRDNRITGLEDFLEAWSDQDHSRNLRRFSKADAKIDDVQAFSPQTSRYCGNTLSRWHPQFTELLEPGVREVVRSSAFDRDWITYTSCEGHLRESAGSLYPRLCHIGFIPRRAPEALEILGVFTRTPLPRGIVIRSDQTPLCYEGGLKHALRIFLVPEVGQWTAYFKNLTAAQCSIAAAISHRQ